MSDLGKGMNSTNPAIGKIVGANWAPALVGQLVLQKNFKFKAVTNATEKHDMSTTVMVIRNKTKRKGRCGDPLIVYVLRSD